MKTRRSETISVCILDIAVLLFSDVKIILTVNMESNFTFLTPDSGSLVTFPTSDLLAGSFLCPPSRSLITIFALFDLHFHCLNISLVGLYRSPKALVLWATKVTIWHFCISCNQMNFPSIVAWGIHAKCKQGVPPLFSPKCNPLALNILIKSVQSPHVLIIYGYSFQTYVDFGSLFVYNCYPINFRSQDQYLDK